MRKLRFFATCTVVLALAAAASLHAQKYSVLYNFGSKSGDPTNPSYSGIVAQGRDGNLYSTAPNGGANGLGAVFKITPMGTLTVLYSFDGVHGSNPDSGLTLGIDGNFYGTTKFGGASGFGTVFKKTPSVSSPTVLHNFTNGKDGAQPTAPPVQGTDGNFYGTASAGGNTACSGGCGTIYKITSGTFTPLYQFDFTHGSTPYAPLVQGTDGNFYGTTYAGGTFGYGVIFKVTAAGKLTVVYNFDNSPDGGNPVDPLVQGSDGNFYGTTFLGGANGAGEVFKITPTGSLTVLHSMNSSTDGYEPYAGLVQATDSNFYGVNVAGGTTLNGTIFKVTPKSIYSVLYNFDGTTGSEPEVTPFQHTNGIVYGDTRFGGTLGVGVFYSLNLGLHPFVSLLPYSGKVGKTIEFLGQGFKSSITTVTFYGGIAATPSVTSGTYLTAAVPNGALTGVVTVTTSGVTLKSNKKFRVTPQITSFKPTSGPVGTVVTITGVSLKQTSKVTFGGVPATKTVNSDTQVTATVPTGAKTGHIAITTLGGTAVSGIFTVTQ